MDKEIQNLVLKSLFKKDIFDVLRKYNIEFESSVAMEFKEIIEKIKFVEE